MRIKTGTNITQQLLLFIQYGMFNTEVLNYADNKLRI